MKVVIQEITKEFKQYKVLRGVSLTIQSGEIYGLLGINGAGKSTLMKILANQAVPTSGSVQYEGSDTKHQEYLIAAMIEGPAIYDHLSAYDNLKVLTTLLHLPEEKIHTLLMLVGLEETGKKKVRHFSLGMKQRLGIAMTLINDPAFLILDEPTNGLDPVGIQELRELLQILAHEKGVMVLISSHILSEMQLLSDRIGILHNGNIQYEAENNREAHDLEQIFMGIIQKEGK